MACIGTAEHDAVVVCCGCREGVGDNLDYNGSGDVVGSAEGNLSAGVVVVAAVILGHCGELNRARTLSPKGCE